MLEVESWVLDVGSWRLGVITGNMKKEQKNY
jgi:hypothetical protein